MSWGGLNPALTSWRGSINLRFPKRGTLSDGGYADKVHGSTSQHQPDKDGTVDAFDMDVNVLGSASPAGTAEERRIVEALKLDFEQDPHGRGQLWIHNREIANADIDNWRERGYGGPSPHVEHCHWESRQSRETDGRPWPMPHTDALLAELESDMPLTNADVDLFLNRDVIPNPYNDAAKNPYITVKTALKAAAFAEAQVRDLAAAVKLLRAEMGVVKSLAARDDVDEVALVALLGPAVGAYVLANLPAGGDQISQEEVTTAVETAFQRAFGSEG